MSIYQKLLHRNVFSIDLFLKNISILNFSFFNLNLVFS